MTTGQLNARMSNIRYDEHYTGDSSKARYQVREYHCTPYGGCHAKEDPQGGWEIKPCPAHERTI